MTPPFETAGTFLMQAQADHINQRHVFKQDHVKTAIFRLHLDLVELLKNVSELTWEESENIDVVLLKEGWKEWHGHFYLFVFKLNEEIGTQNGSFKSHHMNKSP